VHSILAMAYLFLDKSGALDLLLNQQQSLNQSAVLSRAIVVLLLGYRKDKPTREPDIHFWKTNYTV